MKKLFAVLGIILAVLIALAIAAPFFISAETYKGEIIAKVEAATGRTLAIDGPISFKLFPTAGITAEKVTLSNPPGFEDKTPFITVSAMNIEVAVMPLLHKDIVVKEFVLKDPVVNLHADKDGRKNWLFDNSKAPASSAPAAPKNAPKSSLPGNVMLNNFKLENGTFIYTGCCGPATEISKINASIVIQSSAASAVIDGSGDWNGKTVKIKAGVGTLKSMLQEQKMEFNATVGTDQLNLALEGYYDKGNIVGKQSMSASSLKDVAAWIDPKAPLPTPAKLALKSESDVRCGPNYCNLLKLRLTLDAVQATGTVRLSFGDTKPAIDLDLTADQLDLNPFLPPPQKPLAGGIVSDAVAAEGQWSSAPIDVSALKQFNATVALKAGGILFHKLALGQTVLSLKLQQGVLNLNIPETTLYKGTGTLTASVNANAAPATFDSRVLLKSIAVNPLLKDLADSDTMTGTADIEAHLLGNCQSEQTLVASLAGDGRIKLANGEIRHFAIGDMLHNIGGAFLGANNKSEGKNTPFTQMSGSFTIAQGVVSNRDLSLSLQDMDVSGEGTVNLPSYSINYHLLPKLRQTTQDAKGVSTVKEGLPVPVLIEGSLDHPQFRPDLNAALQNALQDPKKLKDELKNSRDILKGQLKDPKDAIKNLKNLLGR